MNAPGAASFATPAAGGGGSAGSFPIPNIGTDVISLTEAFSNYSTVSQIGSIARADGGGAWASANPSAQSLLTGGSNIHPFTQLPSGKTLRCDYSADPGNGNAAAAGLNGSNVYMLLNAASANAMPCWVRIFVFRALTGSGAGSPIYIGKWLDSTDFDAGTNYRHDSDGPCGCGFPLGLQRNLVPDTCSSDALCNTVYSSCSTARFSDVPPTCDGFSPSMNMEETGGTDRTVFYRDNMGYTTGSAPHSFGAGGANMGDDRWIALAQRFTRGTAIGKGRVETWVWPQGQSAVKTMDWDGRDVGVGPHSETAQRGNVFVRPLSVDWITDISGGQGAHAAMQVCNHSAVSGNFNGMGTGSHFDMGLYMEFYTLAP